MAEDGAPESGFGDWFWTGAAELLAQTVGGTLDPAGNLMSLPVDASKGKVGVIGPKLKSTFDTLFEWGRDSVGSLTNWVAAEITTKLKDYWNEWLRDEHVDAEHFWNRFTKCFEAASALGITAHGVSTLLSLDVFGSFDLNMTGLAAFLADAAGFEPLISSSIGEFYRAYLGVPGRYYFNDKFTPYMPSIQDLCRYRAKRILPGCVRPERAGIGPMGGGRIWPMPGYKEFAQYMRYWGFDGGWAAVIEDDLYTEPRHFELTIMGENEAIPEAWWWEKCRRMGYSEVDAGYMVGGIRRKIARTWIQGLVQELLAHYREGIIDLEDLRAHLEDAKIPSDQRSYILQTAIARRWRERNADRRKLALDAYGRDMLTDEELRGMLDILCHDPDMVDLEVKAARVRRYRRVYWTSAPEVARKLIRHWRREFVAGQITADDLRGLLIESGMEPEAASLVLEADEARRLRTVAAEFQKYGLPRLRDMALNGLIPLATYERWLRMGGFPEEYLLVEIELMKARIERRRQQRVHARQLPPHKQAYVVGLIGDQLLRSTMREAGLSQEDVEAQMLMLEHQRAQFASRREIAEARGLAVAQSQASREAEKLARELERRRARARGVTEQWAAQKSAEAREGMSALAEQLIAEVRKGRDADAARLASLTDDLTDALWWVKVSEGAAA